MAGQNADLGKEITVVCEKWWSGNFPARHTVVSNCLVYLLQLCLSDLGTVSFFSLCSKEFFVWDVRVVRNSVKINSKTYRLPPSFIARDIYE